MIPAQFEYTAPETLGGALSALAAGGEAKLLAGGHSLIPTMKLRLAQPDKLVDLANIPELQFIAETDGVIRVGAMTTHYQVESSELLAERCPLLAKSAASIGDVQVRNRGTIGGSVVHADPAADYPAALLALEAKVKLVSAGGERVVDYEEFLVDAMMTAIEPGEILTEVHVPVDTAGTAYRSIVQPASGYAIVGVAARVGDGLVRVGVTGAGPKAFRARAVEAALQGGEVTKEAIAAAAALAADGVELLSDLHANEAFRAALLKTEMRRALEEAAGV
jgi:carbon-monoxide dehydrogenase medium subunit